MLSKRLLKIASLVSKNKVVYDVGSDHGLLPCFLVQNNICPKAYAVDNKIGPLNRSKEAILKYHLEDKVIPILSDGLNDVKSDVEVITIAGMGFYTVMDIFKDKDLTRYHSIIVQVNKDVDKLRQFISDNNYTILDEAIVKEDKFYQIVVFNCNYHKAYSQMEINYGPLLLEKKEAIFVEYLHDLKKICNYFNKDGSVDRLNKKVSEIDRVLDIIKNG